MSGWTSRAETKNRHACVVLAESRQLVEYGAVWEHDFETEDGAVEGAISEQAQTSGISRHVPADLTAVLWFREGYISTLQDGNGPSFGTEVQGHDMIVRGNVVSQGLQDTASVRDEYTGYGVK